MECYQGEVITVRSRATNPVTKKLITDATATALFFNPSKSPITVVGDRAAPDHSSTLTWDSVSRYYLANVSTTGYTPGVWTCQAVVSGGAGGFNSWAWFVFTVKA